MRRIFVSATSWDLESYRRLAGDSLRKRGYQPDLQANFSLTYQEIGPMLEQRIAACDAVVCLIGFVYGGEPRERPPEQPRRSYTQLEYALARKLNKPVYLLLADETTPFDPHQDESDELRQLQRAYRDWVVRDRDWRRFASKDQLRAELAELCFPWEGLPSERKPCNLPMAALGPLFKGREPFLEMLRAELVAAGEPSRALLCRRVVHGLGGVGKTRVALEYAWKYAREYSGLLFVSAPTDGELRANLANLAALLSLDVHAGSVEKQLAHVLEWLDTYPGWLLIVDNVDTDQAAQEVERLLSQLRSGHALITSRIANWSAWVQPIELHTLELAEATNFLLERAAHRRRSHDDAAIAATIADELGGLALALEQAGSYIDRQRLSFAEYWQHWQSKRTLVLRWHDPRLMRYPASVAAAWETTFTRLDEGQRRLLDALAWLAHEPVPLCFFDAAPLAQAIPNPRESLAGLADYSLVEFDVASDTVHIHRLVQEISRARQWEARCDTELKTALSALNAAAAGDPEDCRTWTIWAPLAPHISAVTRYADLAGILKPTLRLMNDLGLFLKVRCQFVEAERLYRRTLEICESSHGPEHPDVAIRLNNLASLLRATNRLDEAESLFRRALAIDERAHGPDHRSLALHLNNLASLLQSTNRPKEAEPLFRRALTIWERDLGPEHPRVATALNNLALVLKATNRLVEAEPYFRRALSIDQRNYGTEHPEVATDLNNLGLLLRAAGRHEEAEPLCRRALAIDERSYGPDHPRVSRDLDNLAGLLRGTGRLNEAEPLYRRALDIDLGTYGPDHPQVATDLNNLATLLQASGRLADAEPLLRRALTILLKSTRATGRKHRYLPAAVGNYAKLLRTLGQSSSELDASLEEIGRPLGMSAREIQGL